jgi:RNA polymerase sigma-70 factor (ECF subfamily)
VLTNGRGERYAESHWERRLIARLQAGEPDALGALFELHVDRVFAFARHLLDSREDAEEVTTEAFLRAFERAASFRGDCPLRGWLFGITRNLCLDRRRQPRLLLLEPEEAGRDTDGGQAARGMETAVLVRRALADLSEEHRLVLTLCDVEEWDASEVAAMLDRTLAATKSLLYRARRALRARLTELDDEE